ncbi:MAG TPA: DUF1496 domain-containing protein [Hyphomicrobiales bacterium]|nr:DUF1496 domain-containing protein [Hyphomicrobiales bacterium]
MTRTKFLLLSAAFLSYPVLAADTGSESIGEREAFSCFHAGSEYSIGAIIAVDDILYRCVSTFDENLQRQLAWVKIREHDVDGTEASIYLF